MNPSAQPWYPSAESALGAPTTRAKAVRWRNDPYRPCILKFPPTPLCGDEDINSLRLQLLTAASPAGSTVLPAVSTSGVQSKPYRSGGLCFTAGSFYAEPRQFKQQLAGRHSSEPKLLWRSFATVSSLDSQGDSQEAEAAALEDKLCAPRARHVKPKVSIPLPRSQHVADAALTACRDPRKLAAIVSSEVKSPAPMESPDTTLPVSNEGTVDRLADPKGISIASIEKNSDDDGEGESAKCKKAPDLEVDTPVNPNGRCHESGDNHYGDEAVTENVTKKVKEDEEEHQCSAASCTQPSSTTCKTRLKVKREERWIIVGGKGSSSLAACTATKKSNSLVASAKSHGRTPDQKQQDRSKTKQQEEMSVSSSRDDAIVEHKSKRQRDGRRSRGYHADEELLESLIGVAAGTSSSSASSGGGSPFAVMGVPLACITQGEQLLSSQVDVRQKNALRLFMRSLTMFETSNAKTLLLQRALQAVPASCHCQCPALVCAVMLEMSSSYVDVEKSLQLCYKALRLAEKQKLDTFEMLARLAITRTRVRVVDTMDARSNLSRAACIAIEHSEKAALGWIVMQMGMTLEISGLFPESFAWYEVAERLARATDQRWLLCDIYCCLSIAYSTVGEPTRAQQAYEASRGLLPDIQRHRHQRPLQVYSQLKYQQGDMEGALRLQEEEFGIAKELGDTDAASHCIGAIALTKRFLGRYDEAAENYMEEFSVQCTSNPRQAVESLTGAAASWRLGGHVQKAYDYSTRALALSQDCQDLITIAKALVELAETELSMDKVTEAQKHLREALSIVSHVDEADQKEFLVKSALCEVQWRSCSYMGQAHMRRGEVFEALQCTDRCHVPNTVQVEHLLLRRQRRAGIQLDIRSPGLVTKPSVERVLRHPAMRGWTIISYSLMWAEGLDFTIYALSLDLSTDELRCVGFSLVMSDELVAFLCGSNALWDLLDAPMFTDDGKRMYGDTSLWPQLYSKVVFDFQQNPANADRLTLLRTDPQYCLRMLYDSFVRPVEPHIAGAEGLMFVGDGIFTRLPFHALHNGEKFLAERFCTASCCSMALLCTHAAECEAAKDVQAHPKVAEEGKSAEVEDSSRAQYYTVIDDATGGVVLMEPFLTKVTGISCMDDCAGECKGTGHEVCVRHVVIDKRPVANGNLSDAAEDTQPSGTCGSDPQCVHVVSDGSDNGDPEVAAAKHLLARLQRRSKATSVRNTLYRAVHEAPGGVLEIRLRAFPEVKEDFCGSFVGASTDVAACHASEVANLWDLRRYTLVLCSGVGTYAGMSMHETGVPVYRALQYAGARCLLMATGSRVPPCDRVPAAAAAAALEGRDLASAVRAAYVRAIAEGVPLADWCGFTLVGFPVSCPMSSAPTAP